MLFLLCAENQANIIEDMAKRQAILECSDLSPLWSGGLTPLRAFGRDRSRPAKALTGQRTPKDYLITRASFLRSSTKRRCSRRRVSSSGARRIEDGWTVAIR